jgi:hypothetical protein
MRKNKNLKKASNVACNQPLEREWNALLNASNKTKNGGFIEELWKKHCPITSKIQ